MMYYTFTVDNKDYKLRLTTRQVVNLEKQLGCNPISIFGSGDRIPTVTEMVTILHNSLVELNHSINLNEAYAIFDKYLEEGNTSIDFIPIILEIYKASGIIKTEEEQKN